MQIWRAAEFQIEVVLTSNGKMVFVYSGVGVKVILPLKQGLSNSPRRGIAMDTFCSLSCGICPVGILEVSFSRFSPGKD